MASEFKVQIGDREWDVEFSISRLEASEDALGRPFVSAIRDERGWRGFTVREIKELLWVQVRPQTKRLTKEKLIAQIDADLNAKRRTIQEWQLVLLQAFNACDLVYRATTTDGDEEAGATADVDPPPRSIAPSLSVVRPEPEPAPSLVDVGTSGSQAG